jgi:hypothetical protein
MAIVDRHGLPLSVSTHAANHHEVRLAKPEGDFEIGSSLALLWQIYSRRCSLQIHFRQCGHRCGGSRAKSSMMAWRTAGKVG